MKIRRDRVHPTKWTRRRIALVIQREFAEPYGVDVLLELHGQFKYWGSARRLADKRIPILEGDRLLALEVGVPAFEHLANRIGGIRWVDRSAKPERRSALDEALPGVACPGECARSRRR